MKQFSKAARDLIGQLQKIDGDNYPEVMPWMHNILVVILQKILCWIY